MERTYSHSDLDERRKIARWRTANIPVDVIAEKLGRHRATIFREPQRNQFNMVRLQNCAVIIARSLIRKLASGVQSNGN